MKTSTNMKKTNLIFKTIDKQFLKTIIGGGAPTGWDLRCFSTNDDLKRRTNCGYVPVSEV